ncbi:MAG: DUF2148 domain-containing protein [Elusimicrobiota bacterium]
MSILKTLAEIITISARTAPKAKGIDNIVTLIVDGDNKEKIALEMEKISKEHGHAGFKRDAGNIRQAEVVILIGTKAQRLALKVCGICGYKDCEANEKAGALCAFTPGDLGIAVGSAVSKAADFRIDNRIMYSAGLAAIHAGLFDKSVKIAYALPLSATGKNPFFDR